MDQSSLYKYLPFNAPSVNDPDNIQKKRQSCFENGEIWYPQANKLNDPFDCNPDFQITVYDEAELEKIVNSLSIKELNFVEAKIGLSSREQILSFLRIPYSLNAGGLPTAVDNIHRSVFVGILSAISSIGISSIGVLSLTENPFDLRMWAHYGGNSKGICLEFERNDNNVLGSNITRKVKYSTKRPKIRLHDRHSKIEKIIYTKSHIWKYEKEWRTCKEEGGKSYPFPGNVRRILFGLDCHQDTVTLTKNIFGTKIEYEQILFE